MLKVKKFAERQMIFALIKRKFQIYGTPNIIGESRVTEGCIRGDMESVIIGFQFIDGSGLVHFAKIRLWRTRTNELFINDDDAVVYMTLPHK